MAEQQFPIGRRIKVPGHFAEPVVLEAVRAIGDGFECRVRLSDGTPDEAVLSRDEAAAVFGQQAQVPTSIKPVDAESVRLLVESARIRLAHTHDRHFAVSLSGIRTLPHQIEAVYLRMLPQPRLRYLLADDPGAGKTIMAGLLIKEMKLREAIDRVLILCPAPLKTDVVPELEMIVRERVQTLWDQGLSGADLVIACVGAGLRAFTRFARVEYANGEEVPAERFLAEVETVVLDTILSRLSIEVGGNGGRSSLAGVDPATRFYTLWRYTYRSAELDAGEAIVFANGTHVELDGLHGLSAGGRALVEKNKGKFRLRDFTERGKDDKLGLPAENGQSAPLIDALHRTLWLMEHRPRELGEFLQEAQPDREQMRLVAQALAGPALKGSELPDVSPSAELSALSKLTANWRSVIEDNVFSPTELQDSKRGQRRMFGKS